LLTGPGAERLYVLLTRLPAIDPLAQEGDDHVAALFQVPGDAVGSLELGRSKGRRCAASSDTKDLVGPGMREVALGPEDHAGIGHIDRAVVTYRCPVEELGPGVHVGNDLTGTFVERAGHVDVRHPERIATDREPLGRIEGDALLPSLDELEVVGGAVRPEPADVAVVVPLSWIAIHVGHEPDIEIAIVAGRLGSLEVCGLSRLSKLGSKILVYGR
jgi:hypothetical protein